VTRSPAEAVGKRVSAHLYPGAVVWDVLGEGRFGAVYRVWQHPREGDDGRWLAVKAPYSEEALALAQDMSALAAVRHASLARVVGYGVDDVPHVMTELVEGETLAERLARGEREDLDFVFAVLRAVGAGLAELHARGLCHRDVTPRHVILPADRAPVLVDPGLALPEGDAALARFLDPARTLLASPEALSGLSLTPASDQYSLGMMLLRILGNPSPDDDGTSWDSRATLDFLSRTRPDCPLGVYSAIARMLKHEPEDRWPTVVDAMNALEGVLVGRSVPRAPSGSSTSVAAASVPAVPSPAAVPVTPPVPDVPRAAAAREDAAWKRWAVPLVALLVLVPAGIFFWPSGDEGAQDPESRQDAPVAEVAEGPASSAAGQPAGATPDEGSAEARGAAADRTATREAEAPPPGAADSAAVEPPPARPTAGQPGATGPDSARAAAAARQAAAPPAPEPEPAPPAAREEAATPEDPTVVVAVDAPGGPLVEGDRQSLQARARTAAGGPATGLLVWRSRDPSVATVGPGGTVTAVAPGAAWVVASVGEAQDSVQVEVRARPATIQVRAPASPLAPGDSFTPEAVVRDRRGDILSDTPVWSSSDPDVVGVVGGAVRARRDGTATLVATLGDVSGSATVTVASPPPVLPDRGEILAALAPVLQVLGRGDPDEVAALPLVAANPRDLARVRSWTDQVEVAVALVQEELTSVPMADLSRASVELGLTFEWNYFAGSRVTGTARLQAIFVLRGDTWIVDALQVLRTTEERSTAVAITTSAPG